MYIYLWLFLTKNLFQLDLNYKKMKYLKIYSNAYIQISDQKCFIIKSGG